MTPYDWAVFAGALCIIGLVVYALRLPLARLFGRGQRGVYEAARETQDEYHRAQQDTNPHEGVTPHDEKQ